MTKNKVYTAIDLKSFYASVECVERGLDPLTTNLVVADSSRTEKTICLAVSPALKSFGIPGRARLFEVNARVREINMQRIQKAPEKKLLGASSNSLELSADPCLAVDFITAVPRMSHYMDVSGKIYGIYLRYISPDDIHVYSIDEVFIDITDYLQTYGMTPRELTKMLIQKVFEQTGITAAAGIGTNLYLAKIAMDIEAKHCKPDPNGVCIAELDEISYRKKLWSHRPITDFWRVGNGYAKKLAEKGLYTMGDIAKCSLGTPEDYYSEELLFRLFGINAELLIDHAWGWEPCSIADIKSYTSDNTSISSGQVLKTPYNFEDAKLVVREMADTLALELVDKDLVTDQVQLTVSYDSGNLSDTESGTDYDGETSLDRYGRRKPKSGHGSYNLEGFSSSGKLITDAVVKLYDQITNRNLLIRNIYLVLNHVSSIAEISRITIPDQPDLFSAFNGPKAENDEEEYSRKKETELQKSILDIQKKFGRNALLKGMSLQDKATQKERNEQIGGHKS